jgi:hypothetical protein
MQDFLHGRLSCSPHSGPNPDTAPGFVGMENSHPAGNPASGAAAQAGRAAPSGAPDIQLVKENGQVRKIIVLCSCGERIELECAY